LNNFHMNKQSYWFKGRHYVLIFHEDGALKERWIDGSLVWDDNKTIRSLYFRLKDLKRVLYFTTKLAIINFLEAVKEHKVSLINWLPWNIAREIAIGHLTNGDNSGWVDYLGYNYDLADLIGRKETNYKQSPPGLSSFLHCPLCLIQIIYIRVFKRPYSDRKDELIGSANGKVSFR